MKNIFNSISVKRPKRNLFDLSHDVKLSCNMGDLVPTMWLECVPGDSFHIGCESLMRLAPMVAPMMHRVNVSMHYWFVPYRLLWQQWELFIAGNPADPTSGTPSSPDVFPFVTVKGDDSNYSKLVDYLGIPKPSLAGSIAGGGHDEDVSAMPFAAYQLIYNTFYRDQNLIASVGALPPQGFMVGDGDNSAQLGGWLGVLRKRAWEHDYFTAALPFAQRGAAVAIPIGNVVGRAGLEANPVNGGSTSSVLSGIEQPGSTAVGYTLPVGTPPGTSAGDIWANVNLPVGATTIADLRRAFRLQEWFERIARGGSRYAEVVWSMFGVKTGDARLQRPEYITGTVSPIVVSEVLQTSETATTPQGTMTGHGVGVTSGKYGKYFSREHGIIMGLMSVMPRTAYMQGIHRSWFKADPINDFYWQQFENIGEQEVFNREIMAFQAGAADFATFGYVPRYAEYKYMPSRVAGDFRDSLDFWHMSRKFDKTAPPALNQSFVECNPTYRVFAVDDNGATDHLWCHILHKISAVRPMQKYGNPSF